MNLADTPPPALPRFKLITPSDMRERPPTAWAIRGVAPAQGLVTMYGPSGSGKSFLYIDAVAAMAEGSDWFGHRIPNALRVVVVVLEGEAGFPARIRAWEEAHSRDFPDDVRFICDPFKLNDRDDVLALAAAIDDGANGSADVVVIDTLNRAAPGADENSSRDVGVILENCGELRRMFGGLLLLVHHSGKDVSKGMRGHSSLHAAMDAVIEVTRTDDRREWGLAKVKDGADGQTHAFRLEVVEVGEDEDGDPITSCAVAPPGEGGEASERHRPRPPKGGNQRIVYDALGPLFKESHAFGKAGAPPIRPCIELEAAVLKVRDRLTVEPKRRTERARQAITGLVASGVLGSNEGWIWLV